MIQHNAQEKTITIENRTLRVVVGYSDGVTFEELSNVKAGGAQNCGRDAFFLSIYGKKYCSKDFAILNVVTAQDQVQELVTLLLELKEEALKLRIHLINDCEDTITILYQVYDEYKLGAAVGTASNDGSGSEILPRRCSENTRREECAASGS